MVEAAVDSASKPSLQPDPNAILIAEFEYIAQTVFQANEDRARVTSLHLISVGTFAAAILGSQLADFQKSEVCWGFVALFAVLGLSSVLTLLQLARLRQAWYVSVSAMNTLKDYYINRLSAIDLNSAFAWRLSSLPAQFKPWSVSFLLAAQVTLLGAVSFSGMVLFVGLALGLWVWATAIAVFLISFVVQIVVYAWVLR